MKFTTSILFLLLLCTCNFSGQVQINEKSTVKFQGAGVSEKDAGKLGHFLLEQGYFNTFDNRTVYLRKRENRVEVMFIVNRDLFISDKENQLPGFAVWHQWISEEVFPHTPTRIIVADESRQAMDTIGPGTPTYQ